MLYLSAFMCFSTFRLHYSDEDLEPQANGELGRPVASAGLLSFSFEGCCGCNGGVGGVLAVPRVITWAGKSASVSDPAITKSAGSRRAGKQGL